MNYLILFLGVIFQLLLMAFRPEDSSTGLMVTAAGGLAAGLIWRSGRAYLFPLGASLGFLLKLIWLCCWVMPLAGELPLLLAASVFPAAIGFLVGGAGVSVALILVRVFRETPAATPAKRP